MFAPRFTLHHHHYHHRHLWTCRLSLLAIFSTATPLPPRNARCVCRGLPLLHPPRSKYGTCNERRTIARRWHPKLSPINLFIVLIPEEGGTNMFSRFSLDTPRVICLCCYYCRYYCHCCCCCKPASGTNLLNRKNKNFIKIPKCNHILR